MIAVSTDSARSHSARCGTTSLSRKSRASCWKLSWSSVSARSMVSSLVGVEAAAGLAAEVAALDERGHGPAGQVVRVAGLGVPGVLGEVADVDAGEVHQLERAHRVAERGAAGGVDVLDGGDRRPLAGRSPRRGRRRGSGWRRSPGSPCRAPPAALPSRSAKRDCGRDRGVGGRRPADHLDAAHHQRRVEEVQVADAVRAAGGVGELRRDERSRSWWPGSRAAGRPGRARRTAPLDRRASPPRPR